MEYYFLFVVNGGIIKFFLKLIWVIIFLYKFKRIVDGNCFCYYKFMLYKIEYGMGFLVLYILEKRKCDLVIYCF